MGELEKSSWSQTNSRVLSRVQFSTEVDSDVFKITWYHERKWQKSNFKAKTQVPPIHK